MKKAREICLAGWLITAILLASEGFGGLPPADATPIADSDECATKLEALSAVHDWDKTATEVVLSLEQSARYAKWYQDTNGAAYPGAEVWAINVTWNTGEKGVIVAFIGSGCIIQPSIMKIKDNVWDEVINGQPL